MLPLICGAIYPLGYAPFELYPVTILALAGLFYSLNRVRRYRTAFLFAWLFGVAKFGVGASWIYVSIQQYGDVHWLAAGALVALFVCLIALLTGFVGIATHIPPQTRERFPTLDTALYRCFQFAFVWLAYEWLRSSLLTGFPVLDAGYVLISTPFDGLAPILGVKGISFAIAFVAAALVSGWVTLAVGAIFVFLCTGLALIDYTERLEPRQVGIVQVNIPLTEKFEMARRGHTFRIYSQLTHSLRPKDLVLWSEAAFVYEQTRMRRTLEIVRTTSNHKYVGTGYIEIDDELIYNSLLISGDDNANYRKLRLVPFGEYVPFRSILRPILGFANVPYSDLQIGEREDRSLNVSGLKLVPAICYEASFENDVRDAMRQTNADAIVVVSEDAWFGDSLGPHQNFEMARMRAREHGRYLVRAANSGISGIVGPDGEVIAQANQFERTTLEGQIFTMSGKTPYTRFGALLMNVLMIFGVFWITVNRLIGWRQAGY